MSIEKQTKKVSNKRQEYLKFKPFADDLRKAESWCELDGVLNRYQTVKNLHKMGYRKALEVIRDFIEKAKEIFVPDGDYDGTDVIWNLEWLETELKKKYTEGKK